MRKIYLFVLISYLIGCANPQKLINRAIKKDPSIIHNYNDTLKINKYFIDSFLIFRNDTSFFEKIIKVVEFDTIIPIFQINIEREKTRQEVRKNATLERLTARKNAKIRELELKNERIKGRLDAKTNKKKVKEEGKTERTTTRQENKRNGGFWFWLGLFIGSALGLAFKFLLQYLKRFIIK